MAAKKKAANPEAESAPDFRDYEKHLETLGEAVVRLESPELSLEEAFEALEGGHRAYRQCREILDGARQRVEILLEDFGDEGPEWAPFGESGGGAESTESED